MKPANLGCPHSCILANRPRQPRGAARNHLGCVRRLARFGPHPSMPPTVPDRVASAAGFGPIVIGPGPCEFDYSGTRPAKALRDEGLRGGVW